MRRRCVRGHRARARRHARQPVPAAEQRRDRHRPGRRPVICRNRPDRVGAEAREQHRPAAPRGELHLVSRSAGNRERRRRLDDRASGPVARAGGVRPSRPRLSHGPAADARRPPDRRERLCARRRGKSVDPHVRAAPGLLEVRDQCHFRRGQAGGRARGGHRHQHRRRSAHRRRRGDPRQAVPRGDAGGTAHVQADRSHRGRRSPSSRRGSPSARSTRAPRTSSSRSP